MSCLRCYKTFLHSIVFLYCKNSLIYPAWCWWDINTRMAIDICLYHIGLDTSVVIILAITSIHHSIWSCHLNVVLICHISIPSIQQWRLISLRRYTDISKQCNFVKCIFKGIYNNGEEKTIWAIMICSIGSYYISLYVSI